MIDYSLNQKTALVCGSTQGIGWSIAREFASRGASCILLARNESMLQERVASLPCAEEQQHHYAVADFSNPDALQAVATSLAQRYSIDILVNNTGGPKAGMIAAAAGADFEQAFRQHLIGNHMLALALMPGMKSRGYGRILNIVSTSVRIPIENLGVSNTIRAAVASWSKTMSNELGRYGITVNSLLPGFIETQRLQSLIEANASRRGIAAAEIATEMKQSIPVGRFGKTEEIAAVAAFLASPAASYVNGVSIPVDGGKTGTI